MDGGKIYHSGLNHIGEGEGRQMEVEMEEEERSGRGCRVRKVNIQSMRDGGGGCCPFLLLFAWYSTYTQNNPRCSIPIPFWCPSLVPPPSLQTRRCKGHKSRLSPSQLTSSLSPSRSSLLSLSTMEPSQVAVLVVNITFSILSLRLSSVDFSLSISC